MNKVHVQYPLGMKSPDLYISLIEPHVSLCTCMGGVHYCENSHLLRHRSQHTCASAIYYQTDLGTKAMHSKAKHAIDARNLILHFKRLDIWFYYLIS